MTTATFSSDWAEARYEHAGLDTDDPHLLCRRCGARVDWLTRHAVRRHGDADVAEVDPVRPEPEGGWLW